MHARIFEAIALQILPCFGMFIEQCQEANPIGVSDCVCEHAVVLMRDSLQGCLELGHRLVGAELQLTISSMKIDMQGLKYAT